MLYRVFVCVCDSCLCYGSVQTCVSVSSRWINSTSSLPVAGRSVQGRQSPEKPGKVSEFKSGHGKVGENGKSQGNVFLHAQNLVN